MPLRLDNAKGVAHMPTAEQQQQKNKPVEPRFKIDRAASPMPENRQPERLAPGRDQIGMVGEIISESWARSNRYTRARSSESAVKAKVEAKAEAQQQEPQIQCAYDYVDEHSALLFQVVRYIPKTFKKRRPGERPGEWIWSVEGVRLVPYRLPGVIEAVGCGKTISITEGEKDCDNLVALGFTSTTN